MGEAADDIVQRRTTMLLSITHLYVVARARSSLYNRRDFSLHRHTQKRGIMNNSPSGLGIPPYV